jgi:hypothetical protein
VRRKKRPVGLRGPKGRLATGPVGAKVKENSFPIKIWFSNISRLWKFVGGDLGGILTWGFFLNSSRLLKYVRKMKYDMPCYAYLGKIN